MIDLSVVVPAFNEANDLWDMATNMSPCLDNIVGAGRWQFVIVDNGSSDGTPESARAIAEKWTTTRLVELPRPDYGNAMYNGICASEGEWAYIINVDFWDQVMLTWCWKHRGLYELVLGSKRADMTLNRQFKYRRALSWGLNSILQFFFGFVGSDTHGQKFIHLPTVRPIADRCVMRRGQFDTELTLRAARSGLWLAEVPVPLAEVRPPRNLMIAKIYRNIVDILRLRKVMKQVPTKAPLRYHRWAREDLLEGGSRQAQAFLDAAERQRTLDAREISV